MIHRAGWLTSVLVGMALEAPPADAQVGGFVVTLGNDTVQVERFVRSGTRIEGTFALRTPVARLVDYVVTLDDAERLIRYTQHVFRGGGEPLLPDPGTSVMWFEGDTIVREVSVRGTPTVNRVGGRHAYPLNPIPLGSPFLLYEVALADTRMARSVEGLTLNRLTLALAQRTPTAAQVLLARPDSVELDYFGQGKLGFAFAPDGRLLRSDWRGTTVAVLVRRQDSLDPRDVARRWTADETAGRALGALSPRDTTHFRVSGANVTLSYSHPATRGRTVWGGVVPMNEVWRLGADWATELTSDQPLRIGGADVPAGTYSLWMMPGENSSQLIVNRQTHIWGTAYNPDSDFVRVPLEVRTSAPHVERVTLEIAGGRLEIRWGDRVYSATMAVLSSRSPVDRP